MKIDELKAAVERFRCADRAVEHSAIVWATDAATIADAFTDPSPIDRERLEAIGFTEKLKSPPQTLQWNDTIIAQPTYIDGSGPWRFWIALANSMVRSPDPQPQTMGDVWRLLERVSRPTKGG